MKIYSDGKSRVLNGAFPKHFRLLNGEKEVPFIRTGRESIRISGELPVGDLLVDEIIRQKVAQPAKLDAQSLAIINKQDFDRIDILNKKLAINQEKMGEQMNALAEHEATLANLETKNAGDIELLSGQTASAVQMLKGAIEDTEKKNNTVQKALSQAIKETGEDLSDSLVAHETAKNPHRITKATIGLEKVEDISPDDMPVSKAVKKELDKKADKKSLDALDEKVKKATKENKDLKKGVERLVGGIGGLELPFGGKRGQVLAKASDKSGDYEWSSTAAGVTIHNDLEDRDVSGCHPISAISGLQSALNAKYDASNPSNYQTGTQVANSIATETTNRENADNGLQSQIDAITASSDVKDIVGTYAELQAYDTSTLGNNDIIKVLQDETHSDETTYYRWNTTTETFSLIGEEGPYYTKSEANSTFVPQTRTVNGKALSSDITLTYTDVGAINGIDSLMVTTALGYTPQPSGNYVTTDTSQDITATKTFKTPQKFQSGDAAGCITIGADVSATTVSSNTRKLGRMCFYTNEDPSLKCSFVSTDSQDIGGNVINFVEFGGRSGDQLNTSPDTIQFTVANSHNSTTSKTTIAEYTASGSQFNSNNLAVITANRTSNSGGSFIKYARKGTSLGHLGIAGTGVPAFSDASATNNNVLVRCGATTAPEVGSATQPVYIDSNGVAQAITDMATTDTAQTISGSKTFTEPVTIQNGQGTGCLIVGANVNSSNLTNNQRKLARINAPSYANKDLGATLIGWDTSGDSDSPVTNKSYDSVCFGGMKKITNCTSPMSITFCVTDTRAATAATNKKYALAMDANEAIFGVQPKYNGNNIATVNQIPTDNASLANGAGYITSSDIPVTDVTVGGTSVVSSGTAVIPAIPSTAADVNALPDSTKYGADLDLTSGTLQLLDQDGNALGNSVTVPDASNFANKNLDNLTSTGKNISNWSTNVTNCITYIPQDIKLELNNGTLTLKAGSKVYVPNGVGVYNEVTISSDVSTTFGYNDKRTLCYKNGTIGGYLISDTHSGSSAPSSSQYMTWYDTANNVVKMTNNSGSTWDSGWSLPICIVTTGSGVFTSIDQVFNGFGYIGMVVFCLPGVKGLIPNGRNADGTYNSTEYTVLSVSYMDNSGITGNRDYIMKTDNIISRGIYWTINESGGITNDGGGTFDGFEICRAYLTNGRVSRFVPYETFRASDYSGIHITGEYHSGSSWYRLWSNGWIEQGGIKALPNQQYGNTSVTLIKTMADTTYTLIVGGRTTPGTASTGNYTITAGNTKTTTEFTIWQERTTGANHANEASWYVCGWRA